MLKLIDGLPDSVVGIEATGKISAADYENILVPAVTAVREKHGKVRMLYVLGPDFSGYDMGAIWQDTKLGLSHPASWRRLAVVSDHDWVRHLIHGFGWMIPADTKLFADKELDDAKAWVVADPTTPDG